MIAHYTAAALVNELQSLAHPSSIDTIPTSANQEDHVSMGATAALQLAAAVDLAEQVLAIEALCAAQGLDFRAPMRPGTGVAARARGDSRPPAAPLAPMRRPPARSPPFVPCSMPATCWPMPPPGGRTPMPELEAILVDETTFDEIPDPAQPGARCQTCDYWERIDGGREAPEADDPGASARASLKRRRLLAARDISGSYAMLGYRTDAWIASPSDTPSSARSAPTPGRSRSAIATRSSPSLHRRGSSPASRSRPRPVTGRRGCSSASSCCRRCAPSWTAAGITAVEAYPEGVADAWLPSPGPTAAYEGAGVRTGRR